MAEQQQQTSLRYLRLQHDFQTMLKTGISCVDEEVCCCDAGLPSDASAAVLYCTLISSLLTLVLCCLQTFTALFQGRAAPHQIKHTWKLLQQVSVCTLMQPGPCAGTCSLPTSVFQALHIFTLVRCHMKQ